MENDIEERAVHVHPVVVFNEAPEEFEELQSHSALHLQAINLMAYQTGMRTRNLEPHLEPSGPQGRIGSPQSRGYQDG